jgi:cytochrome c oxidase subunit 3
MAAMTMVFGATLLAYFITRAQSQIWREQEIPQLPLGLWLSTFTLLVLSGGIHWSLKGLSKNNMAQLKKGLSLALGASIVFLLFQAQNWRSVAGIALSQDVKSLYSFSFYMLTVVHALHVIGGIIPLAIVRKKAADGSYSSNRREGVILARIYWDFLFVVWLVLLPCLWFF